METIGRGLEDLICFYKVAKEGSFTKAAESLGTSKAMVSKQVSRLEAALRSQLLQRTTRSLSLTEAGIELLSYSQRIFDLSSEAEKRIREMSEGASGVVKISAPTSLGAFFFQSFLPEMMDVLPKVKFEADLSNETRDFKKDKIDFAIRAAEVEEPELIARFLGHLKDVVCVSPSLAKKIKVSRDPKCLASQNCIVHSHESTWNQWTLKSKGSEVQVSVGGTVAVNHYQIAKTFCSMGMGIARLPYYEVADDLKKGKLVQLFPEYQITTHPLYLVYTKGEYETKKHRVTKDAILKWFKQRREMFAS